MGLLGGEYRCLLLPFSGDAHHRQDRQTEHALEQRRAKEKNLNNQPKIDSLLLNLISPNWIHVSWPWHINFNYGLLMSL